MGASESVPTCRQSVCCVGEEIESSGKDEGAMTSLAGF